MTHALGPDSLPTAREILAQHEGATLAGPDLIEKVDALDTVSPELRRSFLDALAGPLAGRMVGYRDWAMLTLAVLAAIGDTDDQQKVYLEAALRHGATDDEIADVISVVASYAGAPRAVNTARALGDRLAEARARRLPQTWETPVRLRDHETMVWDSGGLGTPMLLVHALSMDHRFWREVWPRLTGLGRVIAYDVRGHGFARGAPLTTSLDQLADDVANLLGALGIPAADVYGASYGGAVAQHLALAHPERVRSLALIATASKSPLEMLDARAASAERHGMETQVPVSLIRWFLPETIAADGWAVRYARECVRRVRVEEWAAAWRAMARLDVLDRLPQITVPAIAIAGKQDTSATPETMRQTADGIPGCEYALLDPGTHMMPMEQPEALAEQLRLFRRSVERSAMEDTAGERAS